MIGHAVLAISALLIASAGTDTDPPATPDQIMIEDSLAPSLVRVEYTLGYDKGEAPKARGCIERCPNCGRYHINDADQTVREERPLEEAGFLIAPTRVLTSDPLVHPRFVKSIVVRFGERRVKATIAAYARNQNAILLELAETLAGTRPLAFDASKKAPYLALTYQWKNGGWTIRLEPLAPTVSSTVGERRFRAVPSQCLIVARDGTPVGACMNEELPTDDSWKGSPQDWPSVPAGEFAAILNALEAKCNRNLLRVALSFRSPKARGREGYRFSYADSGDGEEEDATERNVIGVLLDEKRILVLALLSPRVTARLQRIVVHPAEGGPIPAKFACTLRDYGGFLAVLERPLEGAIAFCGEPVTRFRNRLLLRADILMQGEKRVAYYDRDRLTSFQIGWKQRVYPEVPGDVENAFLFDDRGALVALPIRRREKVSVREEYSFADVRLTPAPYLTEAIVDPDRHSDPNNLPLSEEEENRLAWMGVELQPLNRDLARANNVSDLTGDGQSGALVTFVHPGSPAAQAGIEAGCILLRLYIEGHPKPLDVKLDDDRFGGFDSFPWDKLDQVPAEYFDQLPTPWPSAENGFTRALTDLGFGTKYTAEFFDGGKVVTRNFEVVRSPPHFDAAPRYKSDAMGLTVRDLTYEVRHYFQKKDDEAGVIVSKVEPGGKAAVAGMIPYEIVTHVNDAPVLNVRDFEKLIAGQKQLRLSVSRKALGRIVKIDMTAQPRGKDVGKALQGALRRLGETPGDGAQTATPGTKPAEPDEAETTE